jgi:hypothetical protein
MPTSLPARQVRLERRPNRADPRLLFAGALTLAVFISALAWRFLPPGWAIPLGATSLFLLAGALTLLAWLRRDSDAEQISCGDVAGALTLIGICAAATIDPEQLVRLMETGNVQSSR